MSTKTIVASTFLSLVNVQAELYADAGFQTGLTACQSSWEYKFEDKSIETVSGCVSIEEYPPYPLAGGDADSVALFTPSQRGTDQTMWCATEERYNAYNELRRESWGYCYDSTVLEDVKLPTQAGVYADGGYQKEVVECLSSWTFKEKTDSGNVETTYSGCVSFSEVSPYPFFSANRNEGEISNLLEPVSSNTDKTKWCAVERDVYNPTPQLTLENRYHWGYCLTVEEGSGSEEPVDVTPEPTHFPTKFPTKYPTHSDDYYFEYELPTTVETPAPVSQSGNEGGETVGIQGESSSFLDIVGVEVIAAVALVAFAIILLAMFIRSRRKRVRSIFGDEESEIDDIDVEENRQYRSNRGNRAGLF
eukprot:augustus_masked-scaffold_27-processed-gene-1.0-mRNA-1 protein AED:0.08 eAED:0.14 QI:0/-1/0/1/-1/1/1/0/361